MSGDNLRRLSAGESVGAIPDDRPTPVVGDGYGSHNYDGDAIPDVLSVVDQSLEDEDLSVDEGLVTESLDEILLALIATSTDETHGTGLMDELERLFDARLSPGTVYPRLHDLESEDLLRMHELVQTKQYSIDDPDAARDRIERAVEHHLAVGLFLHASLESL